MDSESIYGAGRLIIGVARTDTHSMATVSVDLGFLKLAILSVLFGVVAGLIMRAVKHV